MGNTEEQPLQRPSGAHCLLPVRGGFKETGTRDCNCQACPSSHRSQDLLPYPEVCWTLRLSRLGFLPSSFFAARVSSTMGLPLRWVFFLFCFYRGSFAELGSCCAWPLRVEVVSARLNPSHGTIDVRQVYAPRFFVSSQQKFGVTDIKAPSVGHSSRRTDRVIALK